MSGFSRIIIIYNPVSTGESAEAAKKLLAKLEKHLELPLQIIATQHKGHAEKLAYNFSLKYKNPLIISSSGDGGYHEVVNGVMRAQVRGALPACVVLPAGNANDHYEAVIEGSVETIVRKGAVMEIDVLTIEILRRNKKTVHFGHSYVGLGLTPAIATELNRHALNTFREMGVLLRGLYHFRPLEVDIDGKKRVLDSLIITNIGRMAKVLHFTASVPDDGKFEISFFSHHGKLRLLSKLVKSLVQGLPADKQTDRFTCRILKATPLQVDGEIVQLEKGDVMKVGIKKRALRTLR